MGALEKIEAAGFRVFLTGDTADEVEVVPEELLTPKQRAWIEHHQADLANECRKKMVVALWESVYDLIDEKKELAYEIRELNTKLGLYMSLASIRMQKPESQQFSKDELKSLRLFCHPDKHGNNETATRLTQKINAMLK